MAVSSYRVSVVDSPTLIARGARDGNNLVVKNADTTNTIDLGGVSVAYGSGFAMLAGDVDQITLAAGEELYAVATTATTVVAHVIQKARA